MRLGRIRAAVAVLLIAAAGSVVAPARPAGAAGGFSYSIWSSVSDPSVHPLRTSFADSNAVEVGVKFRADVGGTVTGLRFYKGPGNTGTHTGHLWSSTGSLLASATFTSETSSGWQTATFGSPVAIAANTTYVVSYFAPNGHYAADNGYFSTPGQAVANPALLDNPPLHALAGGVDGPNGVFVYSATPAFPTGSINGTNYWVDPIFNATISAPTASATVPGAAATNVALSSTVSATFSQQLLPSSISFTLQDASSNLVSASMTYDQLRRTATLDPVSELSPSTTYTATLSATDLAGTALAAPLTWSFTTTATPEPPPSVQGQWAPRITWPGIAIASAVMNTGKVVTWDEHYPDTIAPVYDPASGTFGTSVASNVGLWCAAQVHMADGRLLVIGGNNGGEIGITNATIFDPATNTWSAAANMNVARWYASGVRLADGRILAISGEISKDNWADTPEIYDPSTNTWTLLGGINTSAIHEKLYPSAYLMPDGRVFVWAGSTGRSFYIDVNAQTITPGPTSPVMNGVAVQYAPGKILVAGGTATPGYLTAYGTASVKTAAVIDLNSPAPTWRSVAPMNFARSFESLVSLADGRVMAMGGATTFRVDAPTAVMQSEIWDPATEAWSTVTGAMQDRRINHSTAVLLPDGRVLAAGSGADPGQVDYYSGEIYAPPYLFQGARPTITSASPTVTAGGTLAIQTPDAASIAKVSLQGLGAATHQFDEDSQYVALPFTSSAGSLSATIPTNVNTLPPGDYYVTIVGTNGVPSVSTIIRIAGSATLSVTGAAQNNVSATGATVSWSTSQPASAQIQYGTTTNYGSTTTSTTAHSQALTGLLPSTLYHARVVASGSGGQVANSADVTFTTTSCPCTIWNAAATPTVASATDRKSIELGVRFRSDNDGVLTGVRFYKGSANTGTHTGSLWSSTGALLATGTFSGESASGWQQLNFATPVAITANTVYVASYHAPAGAYSYNTSYFVSSGVDTAPLHALANGSGGNGVYVYAASTTFPTSSASSTNYWVDPVFSLPAAPPPPVVTAETPTPGSTDVTLDTAPTATFDKAIVAASASVQMVDGVLNPVAGAVTFDGTGTVATFTPTAPLQPSTTYTVTVSSASSTDGGVLAAPVSWSFTTDAPAAPPVAIVAQSPAPGATGVAFGSAVTATFDRAVTPSSVTFSVLDASNNLVAGALTFDGTGTVATFTPTSPLAPLTTYTATLSGASSPDGGTLASPASWSFTTAASPVVMTAKTPSSGATGVSPASTLSATFDRAVSPGSVGFAVTDPANNLVAGALAFDATNTIATFTPTTPLNASTTYAVTVTGATASDGGTLAAPVTWTFTTVNYGCPCTLFGTAIPASTATDAKSVELGVKFKADVNGYVTGVRFYKAATNTGVHVGHLWTTSGTLLASVTFTGESASGWQQATFSAPVPVTANATYVISYHATGGHYSYTYNYFATNDTNSGPLHAPATGHTAGGNGVYVYTTGVTVPTATSNATNYWVDATFAPATAPAVVAANPPNGATGIVPAAAPVLTFNVPVQLAGSTFTLTDAAQHPVALTVTLDSATHTVATLTPTAPLGGGQTYTLSVAARDSFANLMPAPFQSTFST